MISAQPEAIYRPLCRGYGGHCSYLTTRQTMQNILFGLYRYNPLAQTVMQFDAVGMRRRVSTRLINNSSLGTGRARGFMTLADAWLKVDWGKWAQYPYVVIDPLSPSHLQYLDKTGYLSLQRVCLSKDRELLVVATPASNPAKYDNDGNVVSPNPFTASPFKPLRGLLKVKVLHSEYFSGLFPPSVKIINGRKVKVDPKKAFLAMTDGLILPTDRNIVWLIQKWGSELYFWMGLNRRASKLVQIGQFAKQVKFLLHLEGAARLVVRMKVMLFTINSYLAGTVLLDTRPLGIPIKMRHGLPCHIPVSARSALRRKSRRTIRVWASLLNSYKAFSAPYGELDFSKIQSERPKIEFTQQLKDFVPKFWEFLTWSTKMKHFSLWSSAKIYLSVAAGPNHKLSLYGAILDAYYWSLRPKAPIWKLLSLTGRVDLMMMMRDFAYSLTSTPAFYAQRDDIEPLLCSGKLAVKEEAAGKLRLFAIVDYWTQSALEPLHKWIFSLLATIPTDGTFDQEGSIKSFLKAESNQTSFYCYDLTSATDMISVDIYQIIFEAVLGKTIAKAWLDTLTDREFKTPSGYKCTQKTVRYTRGQPMGALSSWGALAVAHHFVVQFAAHRVAERVPFTGYRIVGDDLVISGSKVAQSYIEVCELLCIPLNLKKSFTSTLSFFNFCQQSYLAGDNISPVSLKEELRVTGAPTRLEYAHRMLRRGWGQESNFGSALRLVFHSKEWMREWRAASKSGVLTPQIGRAVRLLLGPNGNILSALGVKTGAFQAWFLALQSGGGLLAPFRKIYDPAFCVPTRLAARLIYELADRVHISIEVKHATNLASMKVFESWVSTNSLVKFRLRVSPEMGASSDEILFEADIGSLLSCIMTWRDSAALAQANKTLTELVRLKDLCRIGPIAQREAALARLYHLDRDFPTLPDFRLPEAMMVESRRRYVDNDLVDAAVLIEFVSFLLKETHPMRDS